MYISRLRLDPYQSTRLGMYEEHQALWDLFADHPDRKRDFIYRPMDNGRFIVISKRPPTDKKSVWNIELKEYDPKLKRGDRVYFSLRLNAVRKTRDAGGRQLRHDIVQDRRKRLLEEGVKERDLPIRTVVAHDAANEWLQSRENDTGFAVETGTMMVDMYQRYQVRKKPGLRPITLSVLDLKGFAHVVESQKAKTTLMHGLGCAKGLGCGLMLVRRS